MREDTGSGGKAEERGGSHLKQKDNSSAGEEAKAKGTETVTPRSEAHLLKTGADPNAWGSRSLS